MCIYICPYIRMCTYVCVCAEYVCTYVHSCLLIFDLSFSVTHYATYTVYIVTGMTAYVRSYDMCIVFNCTYLYVYTCIHTYVLTCVHEYVHNIVLFNLVCEYLEGPSILSFLSEVRTYVHTYVLAISAG